ncbi:hypothetical protein [Peredibacter starrii]|uniref:Uncharacterized protein n=1 Tax=Peredibacter starrii TaxID=28202 RepID=A0AAX4HJL8_9BACT|nr:hypothetical protein [Peredibacter starrii]WPU63425.1 hypothetical protein SOO65_12075 [Peredibacter starrii]
MIFVGITLATTAQSADIFFRDMNQKEKVPTELVDSIRVYRPASCASKCVALEKIKIKDFKKLKKVNAKDYEDIFNPALILCDRMEGKLKTIFDEKKNAYSVCGFKDESLFFAWDYLNKFTE